MTLALVLDLDALLARVGRQVDDLAIGVACQPRVIDGQVPQDGDDHILAVVRRAAHLAAAFIGGERLGRSEKVQYEWRCCAGRRRG